MTSVYSRRREPVNGEYEASENEKLAAARRAEAASQLWGLRSAFRSPSFLPVSVRERCGLITPG